MTMNKPNPHFHNKEAIVQRKKNLDILMWDKYK